MSESKMIGLVDAMIRRRKADAEYKRKKNEWPWEEYEKLPDGSERGTSGYVYVPHGANFEIRGTVRWWRSAMAVEASKKFFK